MHRLAIAAALALVLPACAVDLAEEAADAVEEELAAAETTGATQAATALAFYKAYFTGAAVTSDGTTITLTSNGLPGHKSPYFETSHPQWEAFDTQGGARHQNPNRIAEQSLSISFPVEPAAKGITVTAAMVNRQAGDHDDEYHGGTQGMNLDGVAMFHGVAAPGDDIADEEFTFDRYEGHPEMTGVYHHHAGSPGPLEVLKAKGLVTTTELGKAEIEFFAVMCDGTLVFGCTELDGATPEDAGFDAQNGHRHDISDGETTYFEDRYHTHVCRPKFTNHLYTPEIQYYATCGNGGPQQPPPPMHAH